MYLIQASQEMWACLLFWYLSSFWSLKNGQKVVDHNQVKYVNKYSKAESSMVSKIKYMTGYTFLT